MGECFNCRNRKEKSPMEAEECLRGHTTYSVKSVKELSICSDFNPRVGFQIGGYWSHMWFTQENPGHIDTCLKWNICSDGEFPTDKPAISFHICDFEQMEKFIEFWRWELERRGWISPREPKKENVTKDAVSVRNITIMKGK